MLNKNTFYNIEIAIVESSDCEIRQDANLALQDIAIFLTELKNIDIHSLESVLIYMKNDSKMLPEKRDITKLRDMILSLKDVI